MTQGRRSSIALLGDKKAERSAFGMAPRDCRANWRTTGEAGDFNPRLASLASICASIVAVNGIKHEHANADISSSVLDFTYPVEDLQD